MIKKFVGRLDFSPEGAVAADCYTNPYRPWIGGVDVLGELSGLDEFAGPVTIAFGDARFTGDLEVDEGLRGWSEWTPAWAAVLRVGEHNVFKRLEKHDGEEVVLYVADEPVNTLA